MPSEDPTTPGDSLGHRKTMPEDELMLLHAVTPEPSVGHSSTEAIGVGTVALLVFFTVSGGPMGSEDAVGAAGPLVAIFTYLIFPWIYALPVALVTGELSSQFPEDGGFTLWVNEAFGPFWAFQEGYWSLVAGMTNNAMYMIMIIEIVLRAGTGPLPPSVRWTLGALFAACASIPNFLGVRMVGWSLLSLVVIVLVPYVCMLPLAVPYFDLNRWQTGPVIGATHRVGGAHGSLQGWSLLMSTAFWNFGGFDSASTFAGEVHNPARTYPVALIASLCLITAGLVLPLLACTLAAASLEGVPPFSEWEDGTYVDLGEALGGPVLKAMVVISGFASQVAMFTTEMVVDSHLLLGMAQQRLAPRAWLVRDNNTGAPVVCIAVMLFVVLCGFTMLDRNSLLVMNNTFAGASVLLELAAAVKLRGISRQQHPPRERFKAPCRSRLSLSLSLLPSIAISAYVVMPAIVASGARVAFNTGVLAISGVLLYAPFSGNDGGPGSGGVGGGGGGGGGGGIGGGGAIRKQRDLV